MNTGYSYLIQVKFIDYLLCGNTGLAILQHLENTQKINEMSYWEFVGVYSFTTALANKVYK